MPDLRFRTLGNATIQLFDGERPVLSTDPWMVGGAYFDSWALHHPFSNDEIRSICDSEHLWISHGHQDHLHPESLALLPKGRKILLPDHYTDEIQRELQRLGFEAEVLPYRTWVRLTPQLEVCCLDNINQDAILVMRFGDALLINQNDSPFCGDFKFLEQLVAAHPNDKTFSFRLIGISADMLNFVDAQDQCITEPHSQLAPGIVRCLADELGALGVKHFAFSSSQHQFVRTDSRWANGYDVTPDDARKSWTQPGIEIIDPFVTYNLTSMSATVNWRWQDPDTGLQLDGTGRDDWSARLSPDEWRLVAEFFARFETLGTIVDFIEIQVAGEKHRFKMNRRAREKRGVRFVVPRASLLDTLKYGYFDDLLIGNFMKTELIGTQLYPDFSPRIAKYGGNARVLTRAQLRRFYWHYVKRNPVGTLKFLFQQFWEDRIVLGASAWAAEKGFKRPLKATYRLLHKVLLRLGIG